MYHGRHYMFSHHIPELGTSSPDPGNVRHTPRHYSRYRVYRVVHWYGKPRPTKRPTQNGLHTQWCTYAFNKKLPFPFVLSSFAFHLHTANHASKPTTPTTARTAWEKPLLSMGTTYVLSTPECLSTPIALGPSSSHTSMTLSIRSRLHRYLCHGVWLQRRSHDTR